MTDREKTIESIINLLRYYHYYDSLPGSQGSGYNFQALIAEKEGHLKRLLSRMEAQLEEAWGFVQDARAEIQKMHKAGARVCPPPDSVNRLFDVRLWAQPEPKLRREPERRGGQRPENADRAMSFQEKQSFFDGGHR